MSDAGISNSIYDKLWTTDSSAALRRPRLLLAVAFEFFFLSFFFFLDSVELDVEDKMEFEAEESSNSPLSNLVRVSGAANIQLSALVIT